MTHAEERGSDSEEGEIGEGATGEDVHVMVEHTRNRVAAGVVPMEEGPGQGAW